MAAFGGRGGARRGSLPAAMAMLVLLGGVSLAKAADLYWNVPMGDWSVAAHWGGTLPGTADGAWIANGGTATISKPGATCDWLYLGTAAPAPSA